MKRDQYSTSNGDIDKTYKSYTSVLRISRNMSFLRQTSRWLLTMVSGWYDGRRKFHIIAKPVSPDPDCPLLMVDGHYDLKEDAVIPVINKLDYIERGIKFRNFHTDQVEIRCKRDIQSCRAQNARNLNEIFLFCPPLLT